MTRSGVVAAARALTGGDITSSVRPSPDIRSVGADDVERMKRLIALVPYPTLELAERLRQRYYPDLPEEVLLFLTAETEGRSSQIIRLDDDEIRRLVAAQRRDAPAQELEVRRFLRYVLDRSEPAAGSASHLRWQLDRAIQQLHLSTLAPGEEARPTASLQRLADSPLGDEVRRAIGLASSATPGDQNHVRRLEKRKWTIPAQTAEGTRVKVRWAWPGLGEAIVAALVAAIAYAAFVRWSPFAGTIAEHRLDAYALEWIAPTSPGQPGSLIGSRAAAETDGSIPPNPDIYRDDTRVAIRFNDRRRSNRRVLPVTCDTAVGQPRGEQRRLGAHRSHRNQTPANES
jgi:hypothetical protein